MVLPLSTLLMISQPMTGTAHGGGSDWNGYWSFPRLAPTI